MSDSVERPSKIRKLDSAFDDDQVTEHEPSADVGSLEDDTGTATGNDPAEVTSPAVKEDEKFPLTANGNGTAEESIPAKPLSKNQLKKLRKAQKWEEDREYRKAKRKEKEKEKKIRKAERRAIVDSQSTGDVFRVTAPPKSWIRHIKVPITFVLDCDFDNLMTDAEIISLGSQLTRSYSENKHASYQAHLMISSFGGKLKHRFETILANNHLAWNGVEFTAEDFVAAAREADILMRSTKGGQLVGPFSDANFPSSIKYPPQRSPPSSTRESKSFTMTSPSDPPFSDTTAAEGSSPYITNPVNNGMTTSSTEQKIFLNFASTSKESGIKYGAAGEEPAANADDHDSKSSCEPNIVYLTSDSPHTLDVLSPYTTYIIGGLVDKNRHKGICYKMAMERNIPTAKLPIGDYMTMQSRSVLTTNHVVEIMLKWLESKDWAKAFLQVIPKRKEARLKPKTKMSSDLQNKDDDVGSCSQGDGAYEDGDETVKGDGDQR